MNSYEDLRRSWQNVATDWQKWTSVLSSWLDPATYLMLDLSKIGTGNQVLDIAAGNGHQSLLAARRVGDSGYILSTDICKELTDLTVRASELGINNIEVAIMDAENLSLEDDLFDAVICRLGLMFFADLNKALCEAYRVLKGGGHVSAIVFSKIEKNPFFYVPIKITAKHLGLHESNIDHIIPFNLSNPDILRGHFHKAGFVEIETVIVSTALHAPSLAEYISFMRGTSAVLHHLMRDFEEPAVNCIWEEIKEALSCYETAQGFLSSSELLLISSKKP